MSIDAIETIIAEMRGYQLGGNPVVPASRAYAWADQLEAQLSACRTAEGVVAWQMQYVGPAKDYPEHGWQLLEVAPDKFYFDHPEFWEIRTLHPAKAVPEGEAVARMIDAGDGLGTPKIQWIDPMKRAPVGASLYTHPAPAASRVTDDMVSAALEAFYDEREINVPVLRESMRCALTAALTTPRDET